MIRRLIRGNDERGASVMLVAGSLMFILGSAALAVDTSGFFAAARADQTIADLSCLAGVHELPDGSAAIDLAASVAGINWPKMAGASLTNNGTSGTLDDGAGNTVTFETAYLGNPNTMRVVVTSVEGATFGRVIGPDSVPVTQTAVCTIDEIAANPFVPFGAAPGWDGVLQQKNPCPTGNCRPLSIPRTDSSGAGNWFVRNAALGTEYPLAIGEIVNQYPGVSSGQLSDALVREGSGIIGRLRDLAVATYTDTTPGGRTIDTDDPLTILGGSAQAFSTMSTPPPGWDAEVHGSFSSVTGWYVDGVIGKCASPRLVRVPIVAQVGWTPGTPIVLPVGNSDPVEIIGFYHAVITDPNGPEDFKNPSDALKTTSAAVWWPGLNASCIINGKQVPFAEVVDGYEQLRLISG